MASCRLRVILAAAFALWCVSARAIPAAEARYAAADDPAARERLAGEIKNELSKVSTSADSIPLLYNLFDLSQSTGPTAYAFQLAETATRAGKPEVALDALRNAANYNMKNDSILEVALEMAEAFPESDDRSHTLTFIRILRNSAIQRYATPEIKASRLQELLRDVNINPPKDLYDRIVLLHALCVNLSEVAEGELLATYLKRLGQLIEELPSEDHALKNAYYVWASMIYTKVGQHELAIDASNKLLDEIDLLDKRNRQIGRDYRSYDANRYIVYTRLLENYEALTPEEVEKYYRLALQMTHTAPRAAATYAKAPLPAIYQSFYQKNYRQAFELIDACKDNPYLNPRKLQIMKMYIGAATAIGNRDALLAAYPIYNRLLEEELDSRQKERYRELQVLYDVNEIKTENLRLQKEEQDSRKKMWRTVTLVCFGLLIALIGFIVSLLHINRRKEMLAKRLKISNKSLKKESRSLREARDELETARDAARRADSLKTDFINNMSHEVKVPLQAMLEYSQMIVENVDDDRKKYLATFAERLQINCELVNTIVNDVLQLAELHNSSLKILEKLYDIKPICETAVDAIRRRVLPGVAVTVDPATENFLLRTDRHRLLQILANLLSNAAKFTQQGSITLSCRKSADGSEAVFTVTDTGTGIHPRHKETIFERFTKLDNSIPGAGIGLTISRMLATLLGGTLILDTAYTSGARFILTLPLKS